MDNPGGKKKQKTRVDFQVSLLFRKEDKLSVL